MTNVAVDYIRLFNEAIAAGREHYGLLLTDDRSMPRNKKAIGLYVRVLAAVLDANPAEDVLRDQLRWLP